MSGLQLSLEGRAVVVAGAGGGGIGTAVTRAVVAAGGTVVAVDRDPARLAAVTDELGVLGVAADLATAEGVASVLGAVADSGARPWGLVTVVGGSLPQHWAPAMDITREQWASVMDLNVDWIPPLAAGLARQMVAAGGGGSMVMLTSTGGVTAAPFHAGYGAAKAAVASLTRSYALEWGRHGIRVNALAAGSIATPRSRPAGGGGGSGDDGRGIPMGRRGRPEEVAAAALFLLSDLASYVSGTCLAVDGAALTKMALFGEDNVPVQLTNPDILARITGP